MYDTVVFAMTAPFLLQFFSSAYTQVAIDSFFLIRAHRGKQSEVFARLNRGARIAVLIPAFTPSVCCRTAVETSEAPGSPPMTREQ